MKTAERLQERSKILKYYLPDIGRQRTYKLATSSYKATGAANHMARGTEPHISRPALLLAAETQTSLLRAIVGATEQELPNRQFDAATRLHPLNGAVESAHLGYYGTGR
jgi:hypothetical protein